MIAWSARAQAAGKRVVLVPTMGYLHEGHLRLVDAAHEQGDCVVASIFVNPTQFGPQEDLARYPRDLDGDQDKLRERGACAVFAPTPEVIYPTGFQTFIEPGNLASGLCGARRPGHFRGVCTVVALLFRLTRCHAAVFGEKDYQQLQVIRRMNRDLHLGVTITGVPTVREPDGLALSSRNAYLTADERIQARALSATLEHLRTEVTAGNRNVEALRQRARNQLEKASLRVDYAEIVDASTLAPLDEVTPEARGILAAFAGRTRLIDNAPIGPGSPPVAGTSRA